MLSSLRNFLITLLISLLIFGPIAYFLTDLLIDCVGPSFGIVDPDTKLPGTDPAVTTDLSNPGLTPDSTNGTSFNMLIVGTDYQPSLLSDYAPDAFINYPMFENGSALTSGGSMSDHTLHRQINADTIFLLRVDKSQGRLIFSYIPSDMLVTSGGVEMTLSETYTTRGIVYLAEKVMALTGFSIDFYTVIDIEGAETFVDAIGGVTVNVPVNMKYSDPAQKLTIDLHSGVQKLNGKEALQLLRFNGYPTNSPYSRASVTVSFMTAAAEKLISEDILTKATAIYRTVTAHAFTTFGLDDLTEHLDLFRQLGSYEKKILTYPGSYSEKGGRQVFLPDTDTAIRSFSEYR